MFCFMSCLCVSCLVISYLVPSLSVSVKKYLFVIDSSQAKFDVGTYINICYPLQVHSRHNNIII